MTDKIKITENKPSPTPTTIGDLKLRDVFEYRNRFGDQVIGMIIEGNHSYGLYLPKPEVGKRVFLNLAYGGLGSAEVSKEVTVRQIEVVLS